MNPVLPVIVLDTGAHVSDSVLKQLKVMSEVPVEDLFVVAHGNKKKAEGHFRINFFAILVAALMKTLECGMVGAPPVCKQRVATLPS